MSFQKELNRCDHEILEMFGQVMANTDWVIGLSDWYQEKKFIMLEYLTEAAKRTEPDYDAVLQRLQNKQVARLLHAAIGMATEAGELLDMLKKHIYYGKPLDFANAVEEIGDSTWYERIACDELGVEYLVMLERNVAKLRVRYPEKFTEFEALNRNLNKEKAVLEGQ